MPDSANATRRDTEETAPSATATLAGVSFDILRLPYASVPERRPVYARGRAAGRLSAEDAAELLRATRALLSLPIEPFDVRGIYATTLDGDVATR